MYNQYSYLDIISCYMFQLLSAVCRGFALYIAYIKSFTKDFTFIYRNTCQGLFERHKLLFSLRLCVQIIKKQVSAAEYNFFLKGGAVGNREDQMDNPCPGDRIVQGGMCHKNGFACFLCTCFWIQNI
jgi:hypothetical protein